MMLMAMRFQKTPHKLCAECLSIVPTVNNISKKNRKIKSERNNNDMNIKRGDIYYADLSPVVGSEQGGLRPILIIQNDVGNRHSPTVIAAAITSRMGKTRLPTHIDIHAEDVGLAKDSVILLEQIRTLDKRRLKEKMGHLDEDMMIAVNNAIAVSFGLGEYSPIPVTVMLDPNDINAPQPSESAPPAASAKTGGQSLT